MGTVTPERLCGTWRLVSATAVGADGRSIRPPYGPSPMGSLVLNEAGRLMAVLCDGRTVMPEGKRRAYASYCGNYRIEAGRLITIVDAAAPPVRAGGAEIRTWELRDGRLVLMSPRRANGEQRELVWELCGPA
jgi:Lipocalin-like domain